MIKRDIKPKMIPLAEVVVDRTRNVREALDANYDIEPLLNDIIFRGQQDPVTLEKIGDVYYPIKGFRRATAMQEAAKRGLVFGESAPNAGKAVDHVLAIVYEGLSERERTELLLDHGQRRGLNAVELFNAFCRAFAAGYKEVEIVTLLFALLEIHFPPSRKIGENLTGNELARARLDYYKGVLQVAKRAYEAPEVLREAYMKKLRGEQKWPTNAELTDLHGIHSKELASDPTLSRTNPGPKFLQKWAEYVKVKTETAGNGSRPKSAAMRNRTQVEDSLKILESLICKGLQKIQLGEIPVDQLPVVDRIAKKLEEHLSDEDKNILISLLKSSVEEPANEPAEEKPADGSTGESK